ncbi:transcriptional repressor [Wenzhouxiangella sp. AB-CW3]|uniref:Fur family transcriptional regulator n=1 Tax=Wenzhouxiangella sp. AB-CW3 TaxID=2771012 RepID=UPI00168B7CFE|nr:Fur family transcriptional regulator [Wenzhouxiangella sp. AB-CW3]QOC21555.1 transcriptional repressor [Wenzhouxiangella sp. AB-CW3]
MQAEQVVREVEQHCRQRGLRLTPTRRRVLELVLAADGPVKAYDLLDQLKTEQPGAAPPTIYRALDFLLENDFIHRLETLNAFVSCFHPHESHQGQFLICESCQSVTEIHDDGLTKRLLEAAGKHDFKPGRQVLELYGLCSDCKADTRQ